MKYFKSMLECMEPTYQTKYKDAMVFAFDEPRKDIHHSISKEQIANETPLTLPATVVSLESITNNICALIADETKDSYGKKILLHCVMVRELTPDRYEFITLASTGGLPQIKIIRYEHGITYQAIQRAVETMLIRLYSEDVGSLKVSERVRMKIKKVKEIHKIKKIIYVTPKKETFSPPGYSSKDIVWSHRWLVRGHWRKTDLLGKDRSGNYCIRGFTWVTEHTKGPEDAPLIKDKVRIVKENL